jgi:protease IV
MKPFFIDVLKRLAVTAVSTFVFALFSIILLSVFISALFTEKEVEVENGSFLVLDLSMNLTDRPASMGLEDLTRQALTDQVDPPHYNLLEVLRAVRKAGKDEKIIGIYIEGGFLPSGYGCGYEAVCELVDGLKSFKLTGKPIIGFCHSPSQLDYLVYSICNELHMDPSGTLLLNGLASEGTFLGETFDKYGVGIQVVRVGEFKGAVEPLISTEFSDENRMQVSRLLDLRWSSYLSSIIQNRSLSVDLADLNESLRAHYLFEPTQANEKGLVDFISPRDQMLDRLESQGKLNPDSGEYANVSLLNYLDRPTNPSAMEEKKNNGIPKVAVLYVEGAITDGWSDDGLSVGGSEIADRIREIRLDSQYKALVIRVNSPGGSVSGSDAILLEIKRARKDGLPVVVSMGAVAASGGYWISTECDYLFAGKQTITGSIGVFGILPNVKELAGRFGIRWDAVKTQESSDLMTLSRPKTEAELGILQGYVERIYDRFIQLVAQSRAKEITEIEAIAQGRVWMGEDALKIGLIDEFGGIEKSITHAAELANLNKGFDIIEFPQVGTPFDALTEALQASSAHVSLSRTYGLSFEKIFRDLRLLFHNLKNLNDPRHVYAFLPWYTGSFGF